MGHSISSRFLFEKRANREDGLTAEIFSSSLDGHENSASTLKTRREFLFSPVSMFSMITTVWLKSDWRHRYPLKKTLEQSENSSCFQAIACSAHCKILSFKGRYHSEKSLPPPPLLRVLGGYLPYLIGSFRFLLSCSQ